MQKFPRKWDKITCINYLQRKIILNAIAYYELNISPIEDKNYDELSKQLVAMQADIDIRQTQYGYMMYDFDGTTGFDLYSRLNSYDKKYLMNIAQYALDSCKKIKVSKKKGGLF